MLSKNKAFTLIELLVVVLIIGILAAVALPQYQKAVFKSRAVQGFVKMNALDKAQRAYFLANGVFASDVDSLDIEKTAGTCQSGGIVYCETFPVKNIIFEWNGYSKYGKTRLVCLAKTSDETANHLCPKIVVPLQPQRLKDYDRTH